MFAAKNIAFGTCTGESRGMIVGYDLSSLSDGVDGAEFGLSGFQTTKSVSTIMLEG